MALACLAIAGSAVGFLTDLELVRRLGPSRAAFTTVVYPVIALAVSTVFEGYRWSLYGARGRPVRTIAADRQGRMRADALADALREANGPRLICAQAGNVNTGSFDPLEPIADAAAERGAWLHVDAAFGYWAAAVPEMKHLAAGIGRADSVANGEYAVQRRNQKQHYYRSFPAGRA